MRIIVKSVKDDIKGFLNLVPDRIKKINEAPADPLPAEYGVNALASRLHPKKLELSVSDVSEIAGGVKILTLAADSGSLPFFRAGQGINIKNGSYSAPFSILSSPNDEKYEIAVFAQFDDSVSPYLFGLKTGEKLKASGPEGLFYYISLRDKKNVTVFCDNQGAPALISMAKSIASGAENYNLKIIYCDKNKNFVFRNIIDDIPAVTSEYVSDFSAVNPQDGSVFVSGTSGFCEKVSAEFKNARIHAVNLPQSAGKAEKEYKCRVIYRDEEFVFTCKDNETLLAAFERNSVPSAAKCKVGECGYCRCKLLDGEVETISIHGIDSRREADKKYNFIHPCRAFAKSDLTLAL